MKIVLCLFITVAVALLASCQRDISYNYADTLNISQAINFDNDSNNLRAHNAEMNMTNLDVLLKNIPTYSRTIQLSDFKLQETYAGLAVVNVDMTSERGLSVRFSGEEVTGGLIPHARGTIFFADTQEDVFETVRHFIWWRTSAPSISKSSIDVGDFATGHEFSLSFIRGNVRVVINGGRSTNIVDAAKAIDQQLIDLLS